MTKSAMIDTYDNMELLDSLILSDQIHNSLTDRRSASCTHTSSQEEEFNSAKVDGLTREVAAAKITDGDVDESSKKRRKHKVERRCAETSQ